jgi:hypothetical protein
MRKKISILKVTEDSGTDPHPHPDPDLRQCWFET